MLEAFRIGDFPEFFKFVGRIISGDRPVLPGRLLILSDSEARAGNRGEIVHQAQDVFLLLAESHHKTALGDKARRRYAGKDLQGEAVISLRAQLAEKCFSSFQVVVDHIRRRIDHARERTGIALKIGN
ncbi:MAG: hypothetical protein PHF23_04885 [Smithellaceae bacterium]|nr:hypothetical protein [Smithellaceae bacterium]